MSAQTVEQSLPTLDFSGTPRTSFLRQVRVEFRKLYDTRAGLWLMAVTALLLVITGALTVWVSLANDINVTGGDLVSIMTIPLSLLLPVFAILSVTSEWSQRTGLVTFTHEPHRMRVVAAKAASVALLAIATIVVAIVVGVLTNLLYATLNGSAVDWSIDGSVLAWSIITQVLFFAMAFGFGLLFLNTPAAVALYYVVAMLLPFMVYSTMMALLSWGPDVIPWVDLTYALEPMTFGGEVEDQGKVYAQIASATGIWVVLPILLGSIRLSKAEIK